MSDRAASSSTALVLAGGGVSGIAWMLGVIAALREGGTDLGTADLIVGTSAGAAVGAQLATGELGAALAMQRAPETAERMVAFDLEEWLAAITALKEDAPDPAAGLVAVAALPQPPDAITEAERRAVIAARLPVQAWPARPLLITAVGADDGAAVAFSSGSGVGLLDAVAASCALPGVWPATTIGGRAYVDGGIRSGTAADLAAGHDTVVVLVPTLLGSPLQTRLDLELETLGPRTRSLVVSADAEAVAAFGPNPLDPSRRPAALAQGERQGVAALPGVAAVWPGA